MKYISLDIETTGINPDRNQILEIGAIYDDLSVPYAPIETLPRFHAYVVHDEYVGSGYALSLNHKILKTIEEWKKLSPEERRLKTEKTGTYFLKPDDVLMELGCFIRNVGIPMHNVIGAGKNFASFDKVFLSKLPFVNKYFGGTPARFEWSHRSIDPAILYWQPGDKEIPSSKLCMERAGIDGEVAHTAIEDAEVIIKLIRNKIINVGV